MTKNNTDSDVSSPTIEVACPKCGEPLTAPPDQAGADAECPCCGTAIRIPAADNAAPSPDGANPQDEEEELGRIIIIKNTFGGQVGRIISLCFILAILFLSFKVLTFELNTGTSPLQKLTDTVKSLVHAFDGMSFRTSKNEIAALAAFREYHAALDGGDDVRAVERLKTIQLLTQNARTKISFWNKISKDFGEMGALSIMLSCPQCKASGQCVDCSGTGICAKCKGDGVCPECHGVNAKTTTPCRACDNAICRTCMGRGVVYCRTCQGFLKIDCAKCGGAGTLLTASRIPCKACGGKGDKVGLQSGTKNDVRVKCLRCNGKKYEEVTALEKCTLCGHTGRIVCPACLGNSKCPTCSGHGKTKRIPCQVCGGTGVAETRCKSCDGKATCNECLGSGSCAVCHGNKKCRECGGRGLIDAMELPVSMRWISLDRGIWHDRGDGNMPVKLEVDASNQVVVNGRKVSVPAPGINEVVVVFDAMPQGRFTFLRTQQGVIP